MFTYQSLYVADPGPDPYIFPLGMQGSEPHSGPNILSRPKAAPGSGIAWEALDRVLVTLLVQLDLRGPFAEVFSINGVYGYLIVQFTWHMEDRDPMYPLSTCITKLLQHNLFDLLFC